jgi:hypothetical protein
MPRKKNNGHANGATVDVSTVTVGDQTAAVFGSAAPQNEDGSLQIGKELPTEEVREIGALDEESAAFNRQAAKTSRKKQNGDTNVPWPSNDPLDQFDFLKATWPGTQFTISILRTEPMAHYGSVPSTSFKNRDEFYKYVLHKVHKRAPETKYQVQFLDAKGMRRATGFLYMPDTTDSAEVGDHDMNKAPYPFPPPYGYPPPYQGGGYPPPPPGYGYPPQPPPGYGQGYPQAAPPQQAAPAPAPQTAPAPPPAAASPQAPAPPTEPQFNAWMQAQQQPPMPQPVPAQTQGGNYEALAASQAAFQEVRRTQEMLHQSMLQNAQMIGELQELRRQQQQQQMNPPTYPYPPQAPPTQAAPPTATATPAPGQSPQPQPYGQPPFGPPGYPPPFGAHLPMGVSGPPPGYGWQAQPAYPGYPPNPNAGWPQAPMAPGAAPPGWPQPAYGVPNGQPAAAPGVGAPPPAAPVSSDPFAHVNQAVNTLAGLAHAYHAVQRIPGFQSNQSPQDLEDPEDGTPPGPAAPDPPFTTTQITPGDKGIQLALDKGGNVHWTGMALANAPVLIEGLKDIAKSVRDIQQSQIQLHQQMNAPRRSAPVQQLAMGSDPPPQAPAPEAAPRSFADIARETQT